MSGRDILIILVIGAVLLLGPLVALILSIIALVRSRKVRDLSRRVAELERRLREPTGERARLAAAQAPVTEVAARKSAAPQAPDVEVVNAELVSEAVAGSPSVGRGRDSPAAAAAATRAPQGWETFIGQKAFGWLAVVLFVFAAAFFLRYAYQNNWIGPVGRVAIGEIAGAALVIAGWGNYRKGWGRFAHMLTSAGIVVVYLATYSAFGLYELLPQQHAGAFLSVVVVESMVMAVAYRSGVVALVAVVGGLLTPILLSSDHDVYTALFTYLAVLNLGVVLALLLRPWSGVGSVAYLGTQWLFWLWYSGNYHPEKFSWALGFQAVVFGLYLSHAVAAALVRPRSTGWEELARFVLNAVLGFVALRVLAKEDYGLWLGSAAVGMATLYAAVARVTLAWRPSDHRLLLTALAVAIGYVAWAFPIQADARWVALGWTAMGVALWWFGLRVSAPLLRIMAGVLGAAAVARLLMFDLPTYTRDPFVPIFNGLALPSLGVATGILAAVLLSDAFPLRKQPIERFCITVAGVTGVLLLWLVLSYECYGYFDSQSIGSSNVLLWKWRGQLSLTVFWTVYATLLLLLGFRLERARLRWLAMALYGMTVAKVFFVDMANVQQLYRILAFFVLAVVLGLVARSYQRFK